MWSPVVTPDTVEAYDEARLQPLLGYI
jgi:hypothetical protein